MKPLFLLLLTFSLIACDIETPGMIDARLPGVRDSRSGKRLPARYLEKNTSVRLARQQSRRFEVDPALILGVITQESGFNAHAVSWAGAQGLMQLMPETVEHIRRHSPVQISSAFNPVDNMAGGTWYLRSLYNQFSRYPEPRRWEFALASYNGGIGRVSQAITRAARVHKKDRSQVLWRDIRPYLPGETQHYVPAVLHHTRYYRKISSPG